jgi:hypothetical protein
MVKKSVPLKGTTSKKAAIDRTVPESLYTAFVRFAARGCYTFESAAAALRELADERHNTLFERDILRGMRGGPGLKVSSAERQDILKLARKGERAVSLAAMFGVTRFTIYRILQEEKARAALEEKEKRSGVRPKVLPTARAKK